MVKVVFAASAALACIAITAATTAYPSPGARQKNKANAIKDLYAAHCQMCHGLDGRPPIAEMGFVGRKWKTKTTAASAEVIRQGVPGTAMLAFEGKLTKKEILALARYVRGLDTPAARKKK
jgi:mono/diheme cytochrome c family protein